MHIVWMLGVTAIMFIAVALVGSGEDSVSKDKDPTKVTDVKSATPSEQR